MTRRIEDAWNNDAADIEALTNGLSMPDGYTHNFTGDIVENMVQTQEGVTIGTCDETGACECDENALTDEDGNCYFEYCQQKDLDVGIVDKIQAAADTFKSSFSTFDAQDDRRLT